MADHYLNQSDAEKPSEALPDLRQHFKVPNSTAIDQEALDNVLTLTDGQIRKAIGLSWDLDASDALWFDKAVRNCPKPPIPWTDLDRSGIRTDATAILRKYIWLNGDKTKPCLRWLSTKPKRAWLVCRHRGAIRGHHQPDQASV